MTHVDVKKSFAERIVLNLGLLSVADVQQFVNEHQQDRNALPLHAALNQSAYGLTPFGQAVLAKNVPLARFLLSLGADPNAPQGVLCHPPLFFAARVGCDELVSMLVPQHTAVDFVDAFGHTCLFWAVQKGRASTVRLLVRLGANVRHVDRAGKTPLLVACKYGHDASLRELLNAGAKDDLEVADRKGRTPLYKCVRRERVDAVLTLVAAGASPFVPRVASNTWLLGGREESERLIHCILIAARRSAPRGEYDDDDDDDDDERFNAKTERFNVKQEDVDAAARRIKRAQLDLIREPVVQLCMGLQPLQLSSHELLAIVDCALPLAQCVSLFLKSELVCAIRHFHQRRGSPKN
jgi:hypothetical protein